MAGENGVFYHIEYWNRCYRIKIDALEVMGVNSLNYLVFQNLLIALLLYPFVIGIAMFFRHSRCGLDSGCIWSFASAR
jgi:phospholipid/cholesterol/gamma-HCH transport system permease protein